jgi:hypothetical protein
MIFGPEYEQNQIAYRSLKPTIDQTYPKGRFVAIHEGKVIADAADLAGLRQAILAQGKDPMKTLAVQAGDESPDYIDILTQEPGR